MEKQRASVRAALRPFHGLLLLLALVLGNSPVAQAQHYTFSQFGQEDGLLNQDVSDLVQDARGVLWVGTENGLFRADGSHFVGVGQYENAAFGSVLAMHVDAAGRVWVLGARRLVFFDLVGVLHRVPAVQLSLLVEDGVALTSLPDHPNTLYMLQGGQLQVVESPDGGSTWTLRPAFTSEALAHHPDLRSLKSLQSDAQGKTLWAGCGVALCALEPPPEEAVDRRLLVTEWDSTRAIPSDSWTSILIARNGRIWARGAQNVISLDRQSWALSRYPEPSTPKIDARYSRLTEDLDGSILANTADGLARLVHGSWVQLSSKNGLPDSVIGTMFFDRVGGFWLAPIGQGIWRWLGYGNWEDWTRAEGMSERVTWSMLRDAQGLFWVGASDDLNQIDQAHGRAIPFQPQAQLADAQALALDARGHIWVGGDSGLLADVDPVLHHVQPIASLPGRTYALKANDAHGQHQAGERVWVGTSEGIGYVSGEDNWKQLHMVREPGAPAGNIWSISEDKQGRLWFAAGEGIFRLADGVWTKIHFPPSVPLIEYPTLAPARDGTLWMQAALPNPLLHVRVDGDQATVLEAVSSAVIGSDDISFIEIDSRNWIWVGTDLGVYVFDGSRWVHCEREDGLLSEDTDTHGVYEDRDGSMWFGTASGLSHLLHPAKLFEVGAPEISVQDVRLNGKPLVPGVHESFNLRAPELSVVLFSTYYQRPRAVVFRYRLLGRDNVWQSSSSGTLHFSDLPVGDYALSVQAVDERVHAASAPIDYPFTVLPPWYRRDRTKALALLAFLLLGALGWELSMRRLKTSEATLKKMVDHQTAQLLAEKEELQRAQSELVETARRDALTGLLNRSAIFDVLGRMRRNALEAGTPLSVIMADLDHFKSINDTYGHTVGDAVLRECAERFRETLRPGDAVGRYGGEELLLGIPGLDKAHAIVRLEEVRSAIASRPFRHGEHELYVTCSFGVASLNERHRNLETVVHAADEALYLAKQNGRNRVEFTPDSAEEAFQIFAP